MTRTPSPGPSETPSPTNTTVPSNTPTNTPSPSNTPEPSSTLTRTPTPTETPTPTNTTIPTETPTPTETLTPTPEPAPMPSGDCAEGAPTELIEGPTTWMPSSSPNIGSQAKLCIWMVVNDQPAVGASVEIKLKYLDNSGTFAEPKEDTGSATTGDDGVALFTFTVPNTTECTVQTSITYDGETYDRRNLDYGDKLEITFNPSGQVIDG
ncbi:MAG: hypothetical protein HC884_06120 [Chloroflexaceae bacterium]|nr:hypothetical protein [Chloroflexaceae bacterium]